MIRAAGGRPVYGPTGNILFEPVYTQLILSIRRIAPLSGSVYVYNGGRARTRTRAQNFADRENARRSPAQSPRASGFKLKDAGDR